MSKNEPGDRELALRKQREEPAASAPLAKPAADEAVTKESGAMRTKKAKKTSGGRTAVKGKTSGKKSDRSPLAVGTFIAAAGEKGVTMDQIVKKFGIEAHPMRAKIHAAKHELGFTVEYDHKAKRYTAKAPQVKAA